MKSRGHHHQQRFKVIIDQSLIPTLKDPVKTDSNGQGALLCGYQHLRMKSRDHNQVLGKAGLSQF